MVGKWLERDPRRGWCLREPEPRAVDEIVEAIREATELGEAGQGAGAPTFDHAMRIKGYLQTILDVELSKQSGARVQIISPVETHPMDDRERIQQDRRNRFNFLKYLYDEHRKLQAGVLQSIPAEVVDQAIGVSRDDGDRIATFLNDKRLITFMAMGPQVGITHYGIEYVEGALEKPDEPTPFFPPVNVLMFHGDVHNSQIQQGTVGSSQHLTISSDERNLLMEAIDELRPQLVTIPDVDAREDMIANVDTAAAQLKRTTPSRTILRESLTSLKSVAEQVGAGLIVAKLLALAHGLGLL